ncbi:MAG: hypothetical protein ACD_32C00003G0007 [uncultured bacterium]|uniref:Uncharacterized protein n=1 Tax=Candidatus Daviesbacteria bacterium GW2011_GWC2_40_12 TaxID=1618431 RepID=A0A0G0T4C6_9BACT|nr:MAG: hypothetical protein ACD_32C00003G0007 [uncultured bacterium]KKR16186.1 MAG: hypothetical protein UT45_C0008G0061 [Candidatus Daviesbacteria bacterium GW2011_GWA2_39_33]KKR25075.1 MAG: hypothetical protein UT54_C0007G0019 [Candidatus Daviesbacteria bacterium GW2011_GWB1_39_5]KKR41965.1 MAG: hypothetical protein UT77_C0005G0080 [Candidatus Daviesbacteria bacterium GW2011_GWC2_40_12]OGE21745.1 MAG: hypothetical protein A2778_04715 [Candidatus Daviesbacteria bacterium RIFCSPHIGHO2_01_FULL_
MVDQLSEHPLPGKWKEETFHHKADLFAWDALDFLAKSGFFIFGEKLKEGTDSNQVRLNLTAVQSQAFQLLYTSVLSEAMIRNARQEDNPVNRPHISERVYEASGEIPGKAPATIAAISRLHLFWDTAEQQPWKFYFEGEVSPGTHNKKEIPEVFFMVSQGPIKTQSQVVNLYGGRFDVENNIKVSYDYLDDRRICKTEVVIGGDQKEVSVYTHRLIGSMGNEYFIYGCNYNQPVSSTEVSVETPISGIDGVSISGRTPVR